MDKYSREAILNPKKLRKGHTRWNQFLQGLERIDAQAPKGPILDFGSGVGYFVLEGLRRNMNIWGVDILPGKIERYRRLIDFSGSPDGWRGRCLAGSGDALPFRTDTFSAVSSWYVFEHIDTPGEIIRELVRVTRPGGIISIRAQDARNCWEGHCKIPWVPFLSKRLAAAWIEEFDSSPDLRRGVFDITQPQFIAIFEELNCRIVARAADPVALIEGHQNLCTEAEIRRKARDVRCRFEAGEWLPQPENLYIFAQKRRG